MTGRLIADAPPGHYDIWPIATAGELARFMAKPPVPPASARVANGMVTVELTIVPREERGL